MGDVLATIGFDFKFFIFNLVNFIIVSWLLYKFFFKKIFQTIEERQKLINQGLEDKLMYSSLLVQAEKQSEEIINDAKKEANMLTEKQKNLAIAMASKIVTKAQQESSQIIEDAKIAADREKTDILNQVKQNAVSIVVKAAKKLSEEGELDINELKSQRVTDIIENVEVK